MEQSKLRFWQHVVNVNVHYRSSSFCQASTPPPMWPMSLMVAVMVKLHYHHHFVSEHLHRTSELCPRLALASPTFIPVTNKFRAYLSQYGSVESAESTSRSKHRYTALCPERTSTSGIFLLSFPYTGQGETVHIVDINPKLKVRGDLEGDRHSGQPIPFRLLYL